MHRGYCDKHRPANPYRNQAKQNLYSTARWTHLRRLQLSREPWCAECLRANVYTPATDVDHVVAHRGDPGLFFGGKLQSLCHACHSRKTAQEVGLIHLEGGQKSFNQGSGERAGPAA